MVSLVDAAPSIRVSTFFPGRAPIPTWVSACLIFVASSRVRACVIRAEQAGQHLPTTVGAVVGEGEQGEAEPILERRSRVLPLAVSRHERGVQVDDQRMLRGDAAVWGVFSGPCPRRLAGAGGRAVLIARSAVSTSLARSVSRREIRGSEAAGP